MIPAYPGMPPMGCYFPPPPVPQGGPPHNPTLLKGGKKGRGSGQGAALQRNGQHAEDAKSKGVPAQQDRAAKPVSRTERPKEEVAPPAPLINPTTAILRNIPNTFSSAMLIDLLHQHGFKAKYDYIYLPMGFLDGRNLGYSFVNFTSHEDALRFTDSFHGLTTWGVEAEKSGDVSWSQVQGVQAHVERYRNSPVMHPSMPDEFKPMVFQDGQRVAFPAPTKPIKAPKVRVKTASRSSEAPVTA